MVYCLIILWLWYFKGALSDNLAAQLLSSFTLQCRCFLWFPELSVLPPVRTKTDCNLTNFKFNVYLNCLKSVKIKCQHLNELYKYYYYYHHHHYHYHCYGHCHYYYYWVNSLPCWLRKSGWGGGGGRTREKTPACTGCENMKHTLISYSSLIFWKWSTSLSKWTKS